MAPIKTPEDCLLLARRLAEYYQRRLNRLRGVGPNARRGDLYEMLEAKIMRDAASDLARRINRGIVQGRHPAHKRVTRGKGRKR
jgi:hypothetical protein